MKFLFDNNQPPSWPEALDALSAKRLPSVQEVIHLREKFNPKIADVDFLSALGKEGNWAVISADYFKSRKVERLLIRQYGIGVFILNKTWSSHEFFVKTAQLIRWWPRIVKQANEVHAGVYEVPWRDSAKFVNIQM